jgi:hypothetical protein
MNLKPGLFKTLDHFEPLGPIWINQNVDFVCLNQKRGVTDPSDADLPWADYGKFRGRVITRTFGEK